MNAVVDLNSDLGEGAGHDEEILDLVSSANIACGFHAGEASSIFATIQAALERGDLYVLPYALAGLGELAAARRDWERAATLLAATEGLFAASGSVMAAASKLMPFGMASMFSSTMRFGILMYSA